MDSIEKNVPIRILHVVKKMDFGGTETLLMNIYRKIDRQKVQFDFAVQTNEKGRYDEEIIRLGGKIWHFPNYYIVNLVQYTKSWENFFKNHPEYLVVHGHINSSAPIYLRCAKNNGRIAIIHTHSTKGRLISDRELIYLIMTYPLRYIADYHFGCSIQAGEDHFGRNVVRSNHFSVLKNGIDAKKYIYNKEMRKMIRDEIGIMDDELLVGHVGRFCREKNHEFIIDVFNALHRFEPKTKLLLVGEGDLKSKIEEKVKRFGLQEAVIFYGISNQVWNLLNAMDVFIFPSYFEGLGIALIEAQASGLPCVVSEAIVPEADIGLDLICKRQLSDPIADWCQSILKMKCRQRTDTSEYIVKAGFDIVDTADDLVDFYLSNIKSKARD